MTGLDVSFQRGLNVIIGPRGSGKTTLLELIRHGLGAEHADPSRREAEERRIFYLLGDGEVVLDIEGDRQSYRLVVDAHGGGRRVEMANVALLLGQNELESIASNADSRLRLIDLRAQLTSSSQVDPEVAEVTSLLAELRDQIDELAEDVAQRPALQADLEVMVAQEASLMSEATLELSENRQLLHRLEGELLQLQADLNQAHSFEEHLSKSLATHSIAATAFNELTILPLATELQEKVAGHLDVAKQSLTRYRLELESVSRLLDRERQSRRTREPELRSLAEPIRTQLNEAERGLGELTARARNLRSQIARLGEKQERLEVLRRRYAETQDRRTDLLTRAETQSEQQYLARVAVADNVSRNLSSRVTVSIEHLADAGEFRKFLGGALQGSGLKYTAVADAFSRHLLPRQLLELIEERDWDRASLLTNLPADRVSRAFQWMANPETLSALSLVRLADRADFLLLDGSSLKSVEELSTGQKCAVTLPILLTEHERTLVLDQPEDHLDNAYLVDNVVVGLNNRSSAQAQTIVATHNANIPVLGSAASVLSMESNGRRGYVSNQGSYDDDSIVTAITTVMEGGEEAFRKRAMFYRTHGITP
ncbi:hypothetical protein GCM10009633_11700 [Janibacter melonis]